MRSFIALRSTSTIVPLTVMESPAALVEKPGGSRRAAGSSAELTPGRTVATSADEAVAVDCSTVKV